MSYQESFTGDINTNATKQTNSPQATIKNPLKKKIFVNAILLSFDTYFSEKGIVMIRVNGNIILPKNSVGAYNRLQSFPINLKNEEFNQQSKIEIFVWNGFDADMVSLGYNIQISEDPNAQIPPDSSLTENIRNQHMSKSEIVFEQILRQNQTDTKLIDMRGNKKLRVFLSSANYTPPTLLLGGGEVIDGNLTTFYEITNSSGEVDRVKVDFLTSVSRLIKAKVGTHVGDFTGNFFLYGSNDNTIWNLLTSASVGAGVITTLSATASYRYYKITDKVIAGTFRGDHYEIYDDALFGGTANLSFQALDVSSNQWMEIIASSEFGTIAQGQAVVKEIGDVNTFSISGKTYALPSTQTNFRAKLVTSGSISIGVSITKMS